jgi:tetratricopeptide (TPR) repeat protein
MSLGENLRLLFLLYVRPRAAISGILDEGRLLFGAVAVILVSLLADAGGAVSLLKGRANPGTPARAAAGQAAAPAAGDEEAEAEPPVASPWLWSALASTSRLFAVLSLSLLYAPALLLLVTLLEPVGSFGVAFRRDFGSLLACTWMAWAAARLPFALLSLILTPALTGFASFATSLGLWIAGGVYFTALMFVAVRVIFGARPLSALVAVMAAPLALLLQPFVIFLASPFALYLAYRFFMGDIGDFTRSFGSRQSFKRYLHAATLNPRDSEAHYNLGLIHQQRQQWDEAIARFLKAVEIDARELDAHYQLGRIARRQGRHADAIRHFEEVVARDESFARHEVWREVGGTYVDSGSLEHGRWALSRYVEKRPHDPEGLYLLGEALRQLGQTEAAQQAFRQCVEAVDTMPAYRRHEVGRWRKLARERL